MKETNPLKKTLEKMLVQTEQGMASVNYQCTEEDLTINENGEKSYTQEYLDNMPTELALGVGRHSALLDVLDIIDTQETLQGFKSEIHQVMKDHQNDWESNPRFQIKFDDEDEASNN
jgi:hypothetical protein